MIVFQMPRCFALATLVRGLLAGCLLAHAAVAAPSADRVDLAVAWREGKPQATLVVRDLPAEVPEPPSVAWSVLDPQDKPLAGGVVKLSRVDGTWQAAIPLDVIKEPKKTHRLELSLRDAAASLDYAARATIVGEAASVPWYAIVGEGVWPDRSVAFVVSLPGDKSAQPRDIPVGLTVRDGDEAIAFQRDLRLPPDADRSVHRIPVTPDTAATVGPYLAELDIDSEVHGLSFRTQERFAQACAETGSPPMASRRATARCSSTTLGISKTSSSGTTRGSATTLQKSMPAASRSASAMRAASLPTSGRSRCCQASRRRSPSGSRATRRQMNW
jgi:hypothetical protein